MLPVEPLASIAVVTPLVSVTVNLAVVPEGVVRPADPVNVGFAIGAFVAIDVVNVFAKSGSDPSAVAISFNVSNVPGADATKLAMAVSTASSLTEPKSKCVVFAVIA